MISLFWLIPAALFLGGLGLAAFIWALRSGQFEDLEGAAYRALEDDVPEGLTSPPKNTQGSLERDSGLPIEGSSERRLIS